MKIVTNISFWKPCEKRNNFGKKIFLGLNLSKYKFKTRISGYFNFSIVLYSKSVAFNME
jgi:hypothetical protein